MATAGMRSVLFLLLKLLLVESEFVTFDDVAIASARLARARGDARKKPSTLKLLLKFRSKPLLGCAGLQLENDMATLLLILLGIFVRLFGFCGALDLLLAELETIMLEVPLLEGLRIDLHDGVLDQGFCAHQFVVRRIVDNIEDTNLLGAVL